MRSLALLIVFATAACADAGSAPPVQQNIAVPDRLLGYTYAGGSYKPIANTGTGLVSRDSLQ